LAPKKEAGAKKIRESDYIWQICQKILKCPPAN
jgi:hypothetical protein